VAAWVFTGCGGWSLCVVGLWLSWVLYVSGGEKYTILEVVLNRLAGKKKEELTDLDPHRDIVTSLLCEQPNNVRAVAANGGTRL